MDEDTIEAILLGTLFFVCLFGGLWIAKRNVRVLRKTRIEDEDGTLRPLTQEEFSVLSQKMAGSRSWYFWYIIIGGIILIALVTLVVRHFLPSQ